MKENVLIVDDEGIVTMDLKNRLTSAGYHIVGTAFSGEQGLEIAQATRPDIVLLDIGLNGEMDGITTGGRIRNELNIPVIYVTAYSDITTLQRAKVTEPYGYILKPFEERDLRTTIEMAINKFNVDRKLNEARQWLAVTLNSIGDAVITADMGSGVIFMNPVAEALTGWTMAEAGGRGIGEVFNIVGADGKKPELSPIDRVLRQRQVSGFADSTLLIRKDGSTVPIDDSAAPIKDDKGATIGVVLVFRDFTEKRKAAEALVESEKKLRKIIEASPVPMAIYDASGKAEMINRKFVDLFGYDLADGDSLEHWWLRAYPDEQYRAEIKGRWLTAIEKALHSGTEVLPLEARVTGKTGTLHDIVFSHSLIGDRHLVVLQEITGLRKAEAAMRQSEAALRSERQLLVSGPNVAFKWLAEPGWPVEYVTPNVKAHLGYEPDYLMSGGVRYVDLIHPDDLAGVLGEVSDMEAANVDRSEKEYRLKHADGDYRWVHDNTLFIRGHDGKIAYCHGYIREITNLKAFEEKLHETQQVLQAVLESSPLATFSLDLAGRVSQWNPAAERVFGWTRGEVLGRLNPTVTAGKASEFAARLESMPEGKGGTWVETGLVRKDGTPVQLKITSSPVLDMAEKIVGTVFVFAETG